MTNEATGVPLDKAQGRHPVTAAEWSAIERDPEFRALVAAKRRFILPATVFFIVYYFALPVLVGYFPGLMSVRVVGKLNLAYLFALSQFFMAWIIAFFYVRVAAKWDKLAASVISPEES